MKKCVWSLACQQSVFQDGGENQLASKLRHCYTIGLYWSLDWPMCANRSRLVAMCYVCTLLSDSLGRQYYTQQTNNITQLIKTLHAEIWRASDFEAFDVILGEMIIIYTLPQCIKSMPISLFSDFQVAFAASYQSRPIYANMLDTTSWQLL